MKPRIVDQKGVPTKGAACFTYKGQTIVLDTMGDEPDIKVTINGRVRSFSSMDDAIDHVLWNDRRQFDLDHPA